MAGPDIVTTTLAERIGAEIEALADLPSPSPVLAKLSATLGRDDVGLAETEELIGQDPVIAGRVVQAANAAAYAGRVPVTSIHGALLRLGLVRVRRIALLAGIYNALPRRRVPEKFWPHSLAAAACAEVVVENAQAPPDGGEPDAVFLAALLHDLGLLVLASHYPREYKALFEAVGREGQPFDVVEAAVLGIDHGSIGERLARHWLMPPSVCAAIRAHHDPRSAEPEHRWNAAAVHLADLLACMVGADMGEGEELRPDDPALADLGIQPERLEMVITEARLETERAVEALGSR
jgi:HD-like signal output (HDOD) protein